MENVEMERIGRDHTRGNTPGWWVLHASVFSLLAKIEGITECLETERSFTASIAHAGAERKGKG
jgi:hypothetical protein